MKWMSWCKLIGVVAGMLGLLQMAPSVSAGTHKGFPEKNADVYMPVSLGVGTIRTPEFITDSQLYDILIQAEKPLPFNQMVCMMGVTDIPPDMSHCRSNDPLLRADWIVWNEGHIVSKGSSSTEADAKFTDKYIFKFLGDFSGEAGMKYTVEVKFIKDGTPLNIANPHLIIIRHKKFW
jgi:hypothetical protein